MFFKVTFFCILLSQTSASFFDEFRGVLSSVENSFEKLMSDVVTDVQETIGCTILAVKQVLALGGIYQESSDYDSRCRGLHKEAQIYQNPIYTQPSLRSGSKEKRLSEQVSDELKESVDNVHNTMFDLIDKKGAYKNIVKAKSNVIREKERLSEICALLRRELNGIPEEVKSELRKTESNSDHPSAAAILHDIKALHEIEINHKHSPEANEIHHILNEIVGLLHGDDMQNKTPTYTETTTDNESNDAFLEIESQFEEMEKKEEETDQTNDSKKDDETDSEQKSEDFAASFEGVADEIIEQTSRTFRFEESSQQYDEVPSTTTEKPIDIEKYVEYPEESEDYSSVFPLAPKDSLAHEEAVNETKNLIERSKQNDAILENYFKKTENVGTSVFDDSDFLSDFA